MTDVTWYLELVPVGALIEVDGTRFRKNPQGRWVREPADRSVSHRRKLRWHEVPGVLALLVVGVLTTGLVLSAILFGWV